MTNKRLVVGIGALAVAFCGIQARAQNGFATPYAAGDLLISFRVNEAGTPGPNDFTIDLGNVNTFLTGHAGQSFQISDFAVVNGAGGLNGNLNNLYWSIIATDGASSNPEVWLSSQRGTSTDPSAPDSYQLDRGVSLSQGTPRNRITSVGNGAANGLQLSSTVVSTPDAAGYSYHTFVTDNGNFAYNGAGALSTTGLGYEGATGPSFSGADSLDLYALPSGAGKGTYLGFFELDSTGSLSWTDQAAPVPEPTTCALIALGLGALAVRRRFKTTSIRQIHQLIKQ